MFKNTTSRYTKTIRYIQTIIHSEHPQQQCLRKSLLHYHLFLFPLRVVHYFRLYNLDKDSICALAILISKLYHALNISKQLVIFHWNERKKTMLVNSHGSI